MKRIKINRNLLQFFPYRLLGGEKGGQYHHETSPEVRLSITEQEGELLAALALGRNVLEIGTGVGVSTLYMAQTAVRVSTVDNSPWVRDTIAPYLPKNVRFYESLAQLGSIGTCEYEMAFIDGCHDREAVLSDIEFCMEIGVDLLAFHDSEMLGVREAISKFDGELRIEFQWNSSGALAVCVRI